MPRSVVPALGIAACVLSGARAVQAHDLPKAIGLVWQTTGADDLPIVLTNRGILFPSAQTGEASYALRCNESYGVTVSEAPHLLAVPNSKDLLLVTPTSAQLSADHACSFQKSSGITADYLGGFASASDVDLLTSVDPDATSHVYASKDHGQHWSVRANNLASEVYTSLAVAPSDALRVYAGGSRVDRVMQKLTNLWASSSDGGQHWTELDLTGQRTPFAVHPARPDVVFAYEYESDTSSKLNLLRSEDGGQHVSTVFKSAESFTSFVRSEAGALLLGLGRNGGLYRSTDEGKTWQRAHEEFHEVHCLVQRAHRLWLCGNHTPNVDGVWRSDDDGESFHEVLTFSRVTAAVQCTAAQNAVCEEPWADWKREVLPEGASDAGATADDASTEPTRKNRSGSCSVDTAFRPGSSALPMLLGCVFSSRLLRRARRRR